VVCATCPERMVRMKALFRLTVSILLLSGYIGVAQGQVEAEAGIWGTVYTVDSRGAKSVVPAAVVKMTGPCLQQETITDEAGRYWFPPVPRNTYEIKVVAPGLGGSRTVTFVSGSAFEIPIRVYNLHLESRGGKKRKDIWPY
jgi:hypothetical protein